MRHWAKCLIISPRLIDIDMMEVSLVKLIYLTLLASHSDVLFVDSPILIILNITNSWIKGTL